MGKKRGFHTYKPLGANKLSYLNSVNNIVKEKTELFYDFIVNLSMLIDSTYLGDEIINNERHITEHFTWCWKRNIEIHSDFNINFKTEGQHFYKVKEYFEKFYYESNEKGPELLLIIQNFWFDVFNYNKNRTLNEYDVFLNVYLVLDKYLVNNT
jgi:hypothetical protein